MHQDETGDQKEQLHNELIKRLPYKSQTLVMTKYPTESDMHNVLARVKNLIHTLENKLHESYETDWFERPGSDNENDLIFISLHYLP